MLAKRLGARKVMALINRPSYAELMESGSIDIAISPQTITIGSLLAHVRRGDVVRVHSLRRGAAEAIEAVVHGDRRTSRVVGRQVDEIPLPEGATIGGIVRGETVMIAHHDTTIETDDHVIVFLSDHRHVEQVERLFRVPAAAESRPGRRLLAVAHILGLMMACLRLLYLLPIAWSLAVSDGAVMDFVVAGGINVIAGLRDRHGHAALPP